MILSKILNSFFEQAGLGKEEVAAMIERATSNFLKTMKGEPSGHI